MVLSFAETFNNIAILASVPWLCGLLELKAARHPSGYWASAGIGAWLTVLDSVRQPQKRRGAAVARLTASAGAACLPLASGTRPAVTDGDRYWPGCALVDVGAPVNGDMVREHTTGWCRGSARASSPMCGMPTTWVPSPALMPGFVGEHHQFAAAGADFLQVRLELLHQLVVRRHGNHRHVAVHQRQRAMPEFAGRVGFGMDIGNFLSFSAPSRATGN